MRPFGDSTPALLISTSSRPKRSTARATTAPTCVEVAHVGEHRLDALASVAGRPATVASSDGALTSLSTRSVSGSLASWCEMAAPRAPPAPVMATTRSVRHASRYPPSTVSTVPVTNADASEARNR